MHSEARFAEFVRSRRPGLRRAAFALCGDWHRADDLVQTALAKLYVAWPRLHGSEDAYVRRIIVNANIDEARRPWRREQVTDRLPDSATLPAGASDDRHDLLVALQQLPAMQRRVVVMRHCLDLSVEETAAELGIGTGTVKSHTSRALARLHTVMTSEEPTR